LWLSRTAPINIGSDILIRAALSTEFENSNGLYFDNDGKQFAAPHPDAQDILKCEQMVEAMQSYLDE
jgi:hypothetical protein